MSNESAPSSSSSSLSSSSFGLAVGVVVGGCCCFGSCDCMIDKGLRGLFAISSFCF